MMDILDMEKFYVEFIDAKDLADKQLVYQNKSLATMRIGIF